MGVWLLPGGFFKPAVLRDSFKDLDPTNPMMDFLDQEGERLVNEMKSKKSPNELQKEIRKKSKK